MKTCAFSSLYLWCLLNCWAVRTVARAAVTIVDTFDQGGFSITAASGTFVEPVTLPFGSRRGAQLSNTSVRPNVMTSTLDASSGTLTFVSSGTPNHPQFPMNLTLVYAGDPLNNIANCTEFILGFSQLSGVGTLYVELGGSLGLEGITRVDLTGPGEVRYPVSSVYAGAGHTLDAFNVLTFRFEARSPEFSFTLDEIRLIPEPSGAVLLLAGGGGLLVRRGRRRG